jgi:hypothetical protein
MKPKLAFDQWLGLSWVRTGAAVIGLFVASPGAFGGDGGYVAHEWGTFTSLQGSDGAPMPWHPLATSQLPRFVHDWRRSGLNLADPAWIGLGKGEIESLQRMETPVIYFYSEAPRTVNVQVGFPDGMITEWYPDATALGPGVRRVQATPTMSEAAISCSTPGQLVTGPAALKESGVHWEGVRILGTGNASVHPPPMDTVGSHYFAARETGASLLEVPTKASLIQTFETEKFLFYRGVANFTTPLKVTPQAGGGVTLRNTGDEPLASVFVLSIGPGGSRFWTVGALGKGKSVTVELARRASKPLQDASNALGKEMQAALKQAGLYGEEAEAMVKTWRESWFAEEGTRILYLMPRAWTDRVLPLGITPAPVETVRVMVGRAEVMTVEREQELVDLIRRSGRGEANGRAQAIAEVRKLGRFAEPVLQRVAERFEVKERPAVMALLQPAEPELPAGVARN